VTIVHCSSGAAGVLYDHGAHKPIRFAIWYDVATGEYEAWQVASNGKDIACDKRYRGIKYRGKAKGRLELIPLNAATPVLGPEPEKRLDLLSSRRLSIQQREQGVEDYRRLYGEVWGHRGEAHRCIDERWLAWVQKSSFLDSLIIKKGRSIRVGT
jgi:hypothetical protein